MSARSDGALAAIEPPAAPSADRAMKSARTARSRSVLMSNLFQDHGKESGPAAPRRRSVRARRGDVRQFAETIAAVDLIPDEGDVLDVPQADVDVAPVALKRIRQRESR